MYVEYERTGDESDFWHVQDQSTFLTLTVAKSLVTEGTNVYQMKNMDLIFPLIP